MQVALETGREEVANLILDAASIGQPAILVFSRHVHPVKKAVCLTKSESVTSFYILKRFANQRTPPPPQDCHILRVTSLVEASVPPWRVFCTRKVLDLGHSGPNLMALFGNHIACGGSLRQQSKTKAPVAHH